MTREEALDWIIQRKEHYELDDSCQPLAEALSIAIKALEQESTTKNNSGVNYRSLKDIKACKEALNAYEEAVKAIKAVDWQRVGEIIAKGTKEVLKEYELYMKELAESED